MRDIIFPGPGNNSIFPFLLFVSGIESFTINTPSAKLVIKSSLDYEHTTSYLLTVRITDMGKPAQPSGNITIKVKKNFFDLSCARYDFSCFQHYVLIKSDSTKVTDKYHLSVKKYLWTFSWEVK